jgi:hypothetical protein
MDADIVSGLIGLGGAVIDASVALGIGIYSKRRRRSEEMRRQILQLHQELHSREMAAERVEAWDWLRKNRDIDLARIDHDHSCAKEASHAWNVTAFYRFSQ